MEYSPIKSVRTKNFMCIGDASVDMTKSPITCLLGENESGKTSFMKSITVCSANAFETEHKAYIRTGTAGFGVAIELEDGTIVTRIKRKDGNIYEVLKPDGETWRVDKIDRGYGTPKAVAEVMGFVVEPETKELLNMRTYADKCLFVDTKTSENYKVMYNALKVDNLTRAIKEGSRQANAARSDINSYEKSINALEDSLKRIKIIDMEPAILIKNRLKSEIEQLEMLDKAKRLIEKNNALRNELGLLNEIQNRETINETEIMLFSKLNSVLDRNKAIKSENRIYEALDSLSEVDYSTEEKLDDIVRLLNRTKEITTKNEIYYKLSKISEIDTTEVDKLNKIISLLDKNKQLYSKLNKSIDNIEEFDTNELEIQNKLNRVYQLSFVVNQCENALKQLNEYQIQCENALKQAGVKVVSCPNCGEDVIVTDDKID